MYNSFILISQIMGGENFMDDYYEDWLKEVLRGYYTPPLKTNKSTETIEKIYNLGKKCLGNTSQIIQGYSFLNEQNLKEFLRVLIDIFTDTDQEQPTFHIINSYCLVEEFFSMKRAIKNFCHPDILLITHGYSEPNKNQVFEHNNYLANMRANELKRTFILSIKKVDGFCVPLIPITGTTINDIPKIISQWKRDF
jgi:hypothetical protein